MTLTSRQAVRESFAALLRSKLTIVDPEKVFDYLPADFGGASPCVVVSGSGSERPRMTLKGVSTKFHITVETFVLYADPKATPPWTPEDAEDTLDALEAAVADVVSNNVSGDSWKGLQYETTSYITKVSVGGVAYLYEVIPLVMEVL